MPRYYIIPCSSQVWFTTSRGCKWPKSWVTYHSSQLWQLICKMTQFLIRWHLHWTFSVRKRRPSPFKVLIYTNNDNTSEKEEFNPWHLSEYFDNGDLKNTWGNMPKLLTGLFTKHSHRRACPVNLPARACVPQINNRNQWIINSLVKEVSKTNYLECTTKR